MAQTGFTPIVTYNTATATTVPSAANLAQGELAVNVTDKKLYTKDSGGNVVLLASNGGDVTGPASSTNLAIPTFSGTGGKTLLDNAGATISAGVITATGFSGPLTGNVTGNVSGSSGSCTGNASTVTTNANLTGPITSVGNATSIASQTGTGTKFVVDNTPTLITPVLGVATATSINKMAITAPATSSTLAVADGKTFTASKTLTLTGTDSTTMTFPTTSATIARTDAAQTFTGAQTFNASGFFGGAVSDAYFDGSVTALSSGTASAFKTSTVGAACSINWNNATSGDNLFEYFITETVAAVRGSISYNRAGGLTVFNTTSDYRAKTVNGAVVNALGKVALLKPCTGRMNDATEDIDFFVAHELQEVVPSAVTGIKDGLKEDGSPNYQMVDKSAIIPLLTAAIQEQQALIISLSARLEALEGI